MTGGDGARNFDALLRPHLGRLYRLAYRLCGEPADAEDLVQDVLIKAYARRDELTSIAALGPWLGRVLYNNFVDDSRRRRRRRLHAVPAEGRTAAAELAAPGAGPEDAAAAESDIRRLEAALAELSVDHRTVLLMHDTEGYTLEEIHRITSVPVGTLKSRLHRARARLRALLGADGTF